MSIPTKLERVTEEELAVLHALRQCDPGIREGLVSMARIAAERALERLPDNVVPFPAV